MYQNSISFVGAGRVADALCRELYGAGFKIDKVVSETEANGSLLADLCIAEWSKELTFPDSTKVIIVAVPDHRLRYVLSDIKCSLGTIVAHTAGSYGLDIFPDNLKQTGVFYPLQTFTMGREVSFQKLPIFLEASDDETAVILRSLADSISDNVSFSDAEQRKMLHLAAVFVSNFTNYMLTRGNEIAANAGYKADILEPLIRETVSKAIELGPENSQTGPAIRNDANTIEKQLELLSFSPELQELYKEITNSITNYYKDKK